MRARSLRWIFMLSALVAAGSAAGEFRICNDTPFRLSTAVAYSVGGGDFQSEGWWLEDPGECKVVVGGDLSRRYYYYYARTADDEYTWRGEYPFCTQSNPFTLRGQSHCAGRGATSTNFKVVDTGEAKSFTLRIQCDDCKVRSGWFLNFGLRDVPGGITIDNRRFDLPVSGRVKVDFSGTVLYAAVTVDSDLSEFQSGLPAIISAHLNHNDDCDYILNVHTISLSPDGRSLRVYAAGHYEDWECPSADVFDWEISGGKHRIFEQNGDITVVLTPQTDGSSVSMNVYVADMNADGLIGQVLNSSWFGPWIRDLIVSSIPQTIQLGRIEDVLPAALRGAPIRLLDVSFYNRGGGRLGLRTAAKVTVSPQDADRVWKALQ